MTVKGKWRLDELLGVGGMAAVYAATHRNGNRAALKILHPEFAREEAVRTRFVREGYVANRVDHPGRVAILDDDQTDEGAPFLVMELLRGRTLQQELKRVGKMPVVEALRMAADVLDTLVSFHEQKIVHRDLKPGNIFLPEEGPIKLLDFGVAQLRETGSEATRAGTAFGTPSFMAPEQAMGKTDTLDARADVFAMGATLYSALGGKRLWHGKSSNESYILAATQPAPSLARLAPELPVEAIALVDKALQWDRRNRFQSAAEMRDALHQLVAQLELSGEQGQPVAAAEPSAPARRAHPAARRPGAPAPAPASALPHQPPLPTTAPLGEPRSSLGPTTKSRSLAPGGPSRSPPAAREAAGTAGPLRQSLAPGERAVPTTLEWDGIKLEDVFKRLDRLLKAIRHYGLGHPEAASKVHGVHEAIISVLRADPNALCWEIQPYCFTREGEPLWEPEPPADVIPYNLHASGLKRVQLLPGLPEEELRKFCELISLDPSAEGGVTDIAGALWDAGLTKITLEITDDLTGFDATEEEGFWAETDDVEALVSDDLGACVEQAGQMGDAAYAKDLAMALQPLVMLARDEVAEALAMAIGVEGRSRGYGSSADALRLDPATSATLLGELRQPAERWRERFLDLAMDAMADAAWRGDEPLVWATFGAHARRLVRTGDIETLFALYEGLFERLGPFQQQPEFAVTLRGLTSEMFQGRVLDAVAKLAAGVDAGAASLDLGGKQSAELRERALQTLRTVAGLLDAQRCGEGLTLADQLPDGEPLELLLGWLGHQLLGNEAFFAEQIHRLSPRLAHRVLGMLHATGSEEALGAIRPLRTSANPSLRCEAMALLAESHEMLKDQLLDMIDGLDMTLRAAALSTMVRHQVRALGPGLIRVIESPGFRERPLDAQQEILRALHDLHPRRAESLLCAMVRQHGLMKDDALDRTRTLAAELLGEWGDTAEILAALDEALARRWWNSAELREAARKATERVTARLGAARAGGQQGAP
jgi:serine/threonine protein kinase